MNDGSPNRVAICDVATTPIAQPQYRKGRFAMSRRLLSISGSLLLMTAICGSLAASSLTPAHADSTVISAPGFKVEKNRGWFGRESESYSDALGNGLEKKRGFFRTSTRTKLFGSEAVKNGNNISVRDASGNPLITTRRTLFHGKETRVDGNSIYHSFKDLFNNTNTTPNNPTP
jgi:hypothetical protein